MYQLISLEICFSASFLVERISSKCMKPVNSYIENTSCDTTDSSQHWIWTRNNQLMHVDTLQCLGRSEEYLSTITFWWYYLILEECISTDTDQRWQCKNDANFLLIWQNLQLFMYMGNSGRYVYATNSDKSKYNQGKNWRRFPSNQRLCFKGKFIII